MRLKLLSLIAVLPLSAVGLASFYQYDDGVFETSLSTSAGGSFNAIFMTQYVVGAGGETLTSIDLVFGSSAFPDLPNGLNVDVFLLDDPNGDGDPVDGSVVQTVSGSTANSGLDVFTNFALTPTTYAVGTSFFAGVLIYDVPDTATWVTIDTSATGQSANNWWNVLVTNPVGGQLPLNLFGSPDWSFPVRVNAQPVPEPATIVTLLGAVALLRRRAKK